MGENIYEIFRYILCTIISDDAIEQEMILKRVKIKTRKSKIRFGKIEFQCYVLN